MKFPLPVKKEELDKLMKNAGEVIGELRRLTVAYVGVYKGNEQIAKGDRDFYYDSIESIIARLDRIETKLDKIEKELEKQQ